MAYETKDNSGSIFANEKKESANHPDGKGSAMIDGVEYWVSTWNKKTQEGKPWRSMSFKRKDVQQNKPQQQQAAPRAAAPAAGGFADMDDDVPFADPMASRAFCLVV